MNCAHCTTKALLRCRKHKQHLCGAMYCVSLHRWCYAGDPKPKGGDCEFFGAHRFDWTRLLLHIGGLAVGITGLVICWSHFARIK